MKANQRLVSTSDAGGGTLSQPTPSSTEAVPS